jgi:ABC-type branched-subunit amino acid transport system ATPase component
MPLEVRGLAKRFGPLRAVHDLAFDVPRQGGITALIGPNGAGKTTTFNLISGFLAPDAGQVLFEGREITGWPAHRVARAGLARSFQDMRIFPGMPVLDNVAIGVADQPGENPLRALLEIARCRRQERSNRRRAAELLDFVGLGSLQAALASELSYGQQKLVSLARLLALGPRLLMLDEPTAGLDPVIREEMCALMRRLAGQGTAILLIEHNMEVVRAVADRTIFLADGTAVAAGATAEILGDRELARLYFGM